MAAGNFLNKVRYRARWAWNDLAAALGLQQSEVPAKRYRRVLIYHGIDQRGEKQLNSRFIARKVLEWQFSWMAQRCHVVPIREFVAGAAHPKKPTIALSFDDGYRNNLSVALPLAEQFGLPVTLFVTSLRRHGFDIQWADLLDLVAHTSGAPFHLLGRDFLLRKGAYHCRATGEPLKALTRKMQASELLALREVLENHAQFRKNAAWNLYWQQLKAEELRKLARHPLATIGLHGDHHASLNALAEAEIRSEILEPKAWLEELCQQEMDLLAFPSGDYNEDVLRIAADCGMRYQFAVNLNRPEDRDKLALIPRLGINPHFSWHNQRRVMEKGGYG